MDPSIQQVLLPFPIPSSDEEAFLFAMQLATFSVLPMTIKAAVELDVFGIIARAGPGAYLSATEISSQFPTQNPGGNPGGLDRMLRLLASYNVLTCSLVITDAGTGKVEGKYGATPVVKFLAKGGDDGVSLAPLVLLDGDNSLWARWNYMKDAVMNGGIPFEKANNGTGAFEYIGNHPKVRMLFNDAATSFATIYMEGMLDKYKGFDDDDDISVLVDVGGGGGGNLHRILKKHPHIIKGINFDLPHVIDKAPQISGMEHIAGDMFESVPSGDAIFLKSVLHDWDDEHCVKLLMNCWKSLPEKGKVIVMERCVPTYPELTRAAQTFHHLDISMFSMFSDKERNKEEFESLAKKAGFSRTNYPCSYATISIIEFCK